MGLVKVAILATICVTALWGCGPSVKLDLEPCDGWTGGAVDTERRLLLAASAEKHGRLCNAAKLEAAKKLYQGG